MFNIEEMLKMWPKTFPNLVVKLNRCTEYFNYKLKKEISIIIFKEIVVNNN